MVEQQIPKFLKVLAYTNYVCGFGVIIGGLILYSIIPRLFNSYLGSYLGDFNQYIDLSGIVSTVSIAISMSLVVGGLFQIGVGYGYLKQKKWARSATIAGAFMSLVFGIFYLNPANLIGGGIFEILNILGIIPSILLIYYFFTKPVKEWFEGQITTTSQPQKTTIPTQEIEKQENGNNTKIEQINPEEDIAKQYIKDYKKTYDKEELIMGLQSHKISEENARKYVEKFF